MELMRLDPTVALNLANQHQRSVHDRVYRKPRRWWAPAPSPRVPAGVTAVPRIPQQRPAEHTAYAEPPVYAEPTSRAS